MSARKVRCNVYVCKGCANDCPDGAVVAVRSEGPGDYSNDEVSNNESSSGDEEQAKKEAEESCTDGEEDCRSPSKKGSSSDDEEESKEKAGQAHSGDGASLEEVEKIVGTRRSKTDGDKNEFKIRWKGYGPGDDTWEPEEALLCPDLVEAFWEERRVCHDPGLGGDYRDRKDAAGYASDDSEPEVADHFA